MAKKKTMQAVKDGASIAGTLATNYGASYMAGKHHDLRVGFGRKEGEELPLIKDARAQGTLLSAVVHVGARMMGHDGVANVAKDATVALGTSVTSTEAIRKRVREAVSDNAPAAAHANVD